MTAVLRQGARALLGVLLAGVCALLLAVAVVPPVLGWVSLTVLPGSAEPALPTGSRIVVEPLADEDEVARLVAGDVVAYVPATGDGARATLGTVRAGLDPQGALRLSTGGDGNPAAAGDTVPATQVRGVVRYHVPWAGYAGTLLDAEQKRAGTVLVAAALLGYALRQAAGSAPGRGSGPETAPGRAAGVPADRSVAAGLSR